MPTRARRFTSQASVGMFASRIPSSQLSKNDSFSTVKKRPVLHYTCAGRAICASFDPLGVYIYAVGVESCATRLTLLRSVPLRPEPWPRMAPLVEFGAVLGVSASLPLPAPPLPSSSRRYAPQCFVGGIPPPRLATCLTARPTNRVVACRSVRHSPPRPLPHLP